MSPRYAACQYFPVATSTGRQKHLNLLIEDRSLENSKVYGGTTEVSPSTLDRPESAASIEEAASTGPQTWQPSVKESRENAVKISHRRTPTGQFFQMVNPTMLKEQPASTYTPEGRLTERAYDQLHGTTHQSPSGTLRSNSNSNGYSPAEATRPYSNGGQCGSGAGGAGGSPSAGGKPWTMPWETGNRATGRVMAESIRQFRTPSGGFANRDLAKAI